MFGDETEINRNVTKINQIGKQITKKQSNKRYRKKVRREIETRRKTPEGCVNICTTSDRYWNTTPQRKRRVLGKMV